jgi:NADP-dependent 3-hydroxy acid dehydrogenase YdfG
VNLTGAVVAVTGASSGIGRETALEFARAGARVSLGARRLERLEAVAEAARALGADCFVMALDVADAAQVSRFVDATLARFGRLDVLVNNAGFGVRGRVEDTPQADFERLMRVNFLGTVYGCQAALPHMKRRVAAVIINVSSIVGHTAPRPEGAPTPPPRRRRSASRESLRAELRGSGVHACNRPSRRHGDRVRGGRAARVGRPHQRAAGPAAERRCGGPRDRTVRRAAGGPEVYPYRAARLLVWLNALAPEWWTASRRARGAAPAGSRRFRTSPASSSVWRGLPLAIRSPTSHISAWCSAAAFSARARSS